MPQFKQEPQSGRFCFERLEINSWSYCTNQCHIVLLLIVLFLLPLNSFICLQTFFIYF